MRGCDYCTLNSVKGVQKIKGTVEGKNIFVWAQSPGPKENLQGTELIGPSGQWFWSRMAEAGLKRSDCDIQNAVKCFPSDRVNGTLKMRTPTKEEIFCCSLYTEQAISKSKAKVHIVLGKIACEQLFGKKFHREPTFWSDKLNGRVVLLDHPAYFLRGYASANKLRAFKEGLQAAARFVKETGGKFSYLLKQDYEGITSGARAEIVARDIREGAKTVRIAVDIEDDEVDGKRVMLCCGFSQKSGTADVFLLDHPTGIAVSSSERQKIRKVVMFLLSDPNIRKSCHHGSYDVGNTPKLLGCAFEGYDYDTNYAEYFRFPGRRSYALAEVAAVRYPDFTGFKEIIMPYAAPEGMSHDKANKAGALRFAKVPWKNLVLRNGADADLTKRIEVSTKALVSMPLLHMYMDAAFTLERMEKNGPWFDYKQCELLGEIYPTRLKRQKEALQLMAGDPNFNPGSPTQVADVMYGKLGLPQIGDETGTGNAILIALKPYHEFPERIIQYRADSKLESTYRLAFKTCADAHKGRLFTKWWLTGTKTGRLSSGGSREGEEFLTVNLQNIVGDQQVENMLVSDTRWRDLYDVWKTSDREDWWEAFLDYDVYLKFDYAQNELRFLAQSSQDEALIAAFNSGNDIHVEVGHELTGWRRELIAKDRDKRTMIKGFHFGLVYGLTVEGMVANMRRAGVSTALATVKRVQEMYDGYFVKYKGVKRFIDNKRREAQEKGYVENLLGFRCPIDVNADSGGFWANLAINAPIQGGAHQVLMICLALLHRDQEKYKLIRTPEAENHDALSIRLKLRKLFEAMHIVKTLAEKDVIHSLKQDFKLDWRVPFKADVKAGFRYGVMVEIDEHSTMQDFMNNWCTENQKCQRELWIELKKVRSQ
jgi:DNA polymerase-1